MDNFSQDIIKEIEARGVAPKPRWHFLATRGVFWILAILSVLIGAAAFAVAKFVFLDNDGLSVAALEQSSVYDIAQSIPFIWLAILALFSACAYLGFRQTPRGYKYATAGVVLAAILGSLLIGTALDEIDFGQALHEYLLHHTPFYDSLIHSRDDILD